jgi:DNA-binding GntR family transcriptional regulator
MNKQQSVIIPVREQIYNHIKKAILSNVYKPGDIIQIDKLAGEFGVSATPIRETFIRLENSGLLKLIPNKGAKVVEITDQDVRDTWEMRKILEPYAGRLTAAMDVTEEIEFLEFRINSFMKGQFDLDNYTQLDNDVHQLFYIHIQNPLFIKTISRIHDLSMRMRYQAENVPENNKKVVQEVCLEHLHLLAMLKSGDGTKAEKSILKHIENGMKRTLATTKH